MSMTRKDYVLIAEAIRTWKPEAIAGVPIPEQSAQHMRLTLARDMANALRDTNPRFDRDRFINYATGGN